MSERQNWSSPRTRGKISSASSPSPTVEQACVVVYFSHRGRASPRRRLIQGRTRHWWRRWESSRTTSPCPGIGGAGAEVEEKQDGGRRRSAAELSDVGWRRRSSSPLTWSRGGGSADLGASSVIVAPSPPSRVDELPPSSCCCWRAALVLLEAAKPLGARRRKSSSPPSPRPTSPLRGDGERRRIGVPAREKLRRGGAPSIPSRRRGGTDALQWSLLLEHICDALVF
jgi:hypothetical protein